MATFSGAPVGSILNNDGSPWFDGSRYSGAGTRQYVDNNVFEHPEQYINPAVPANLIPVALSDGDAAPSAEWLGQVIINVFSRDWGATARGEGGTGREQNLGAAPADLMGVGFDYFERLLVNFSTLDVGNVISELNYDVEVQNTYRTDPLTITSITVAGDSGLSIAPSSTPLDLQPQETLAFVLTVGVAGPPAISGTVSFITAVRTAVISVTGNRIVGLQFVPQRRATESLEWLTDVLRSQKGYEQRHGLRVYPRQKIDYEYFLTDASDVRNMQSLLLGWLGRVFGVPLWWLARPISQDLAVDDQTVLIPNDALESEFRDGGLVLLWQDNGGADPTFEFLQIQTVNGSPEGLTLTTGTVNAYDAAKTVVVPVVPAYLESGADQLTPQAGDVSRFRLSFLSNDNEIDIDTDLDISDWSTLAWDNQDVPILDDDNIMLSNSLQESWSQKIQELDFKTGVFRRFSNEQNARRSTPFVMQADSNAELSRVKKLLYYLRGRLRHVWIPTRRADLELASGSSDLSTTVSVVSDGYAKYVQAYAPFMGLVVERTDGTRDYHRITGSNEENDGTDTLTITPGLDGELTLANVERLEFMMLARLAGDDVTLVHEWSTEDGTIDSRIEATFVGDIVDTS